MKSGLWVVDAMTRKPVSTPPDTTIRDAAEIMEHHNVNSLVVKEGRELLGIVAETDMVRRGILDGFDPNKTPVKSIMTSDIVTVTPTMDLFDVIQIMKDTHVHTIPVLDEGTMVGFITAKDILKLQPDLFQNFVDTFALKEERRKMRLIR